MAKVKLPKEKPIGPGFISDRREIAPKSIPVISVRRGVVVNCGILNIRENPRINANILYTIPAHSRVTIHGDHLEVHGGSEKPTRWFAVEIDMDGPPKRGYAVAQYIEEKTNA